ncbi:MAG: lactate utilization protein [Bacteroidales bacterium]|nr:lactate utilization protein [Bacteroidales bacterium]
MKESTSKEKVLKKIRNALIYPSPNPYSEIDFEKPVYVSNEVDSPDVIFAQRFVEAGGRFVYCEDITKFLDNISLLINQNKWENIFCADDNIKRLLTAKGIYFYDIEDKFHEMKVGITGCEFLISRLGSIMVSSRQQSGRRLNIFPPVHIVVAYTSQLVGDLKEALSKIKEKYGTRLPSLISVITGPSRTADIEKTLVMGAHGPKELYIFLIDDTFQLK